MADLDPRGTIVEHLTPPSAGELPVRSEPATVDIFDTDGQLLALTLPSDPTSPECGRGVSTDMTQACSVSQLRPLSVSRASQSGQRSPGASPLR
ncbi:MAG: hypothetical protein ACR2NR_01490 [Solirubrobacteraceae bacterium]